MASTGAGDDVAFTYATVEVTPAMLRCWGNNTCFADVMKCPAFATAVRQAADECTSYAGILCTPAELVRFTDNGKVLIADELVWQLDVAYRVRHDYARDDMAKLRVLSDLMELNRRQSTSFLNGGDQQAAMRTCAELARRVINECAPK